MHKSIDTASSQHQHSTHHLCQYFYSYMHAWGLLDGKLTNTNTNLLTLSSLLQLLTLTAIKTSCGLSWRQSCWSYKESYAWLYYLFCWLTDRTQTTNFIALKPNCWDYFYPQVFYFFFVVFSRHLMICSCSSIFAIKAYYMWNTLS
jgi:hypothetical protein